LVTVDAKPLRNFVISVLRSKLQAIFPTRLQWSIAICWNCFSFSSIRSGHKTLKSVMGLLNGTLYMCSAIVL